MKFKVGQKIRMVRNESEAQVGDTGIIQALPCSSSPTYDSYAVEFPCFAGTDCGHNCHGLVPSNNGHWISENQMELASEQEEPMTFKEKLRAFKGGTAVLHAPTQEIWDKLMVELEKQGYKWLDESAPTSEPWSPSRWVDYKGIILRSSGIAYWGDSGEIVELTEDDFIVEPSSVTIISPSGEEKHIHAVVTKKDNDYIIKETRIPKFSVGDNFVSKEGVLGKVLDFSNKGEYYYRWITSENYYSLPLEKFEDIMSKVEW